MIGSRVAGDATELHGYQYREITGQATLAGRI
jgi:hypothetical protein